MSVPACRQYQSAFSCIVSISIRAVNRIIQFPFDPFNSGIIIHGKTMVTEFLPLLDAPFQLFHSLKHSLFNGTALKSVSGNQIRNHLRIAGCLKNASLQFQLLPQFKGIGKISVMA